MEVWKAKGFGFSESLLQLVVSGDFYVDKQTAYSADAEAEGIFSDIEKHPTRTIQ